MMLDTPYNAPAADLTGLIAPSLSLNLEGVSDWSTQLPFLDLMKSSRTFFAATTTEWSSMSGKELRDGGYLDEHGWPKEIPPGMGAVRTIWSGAGNSEADAQRAGIYVMHYEGEGKIELAGRVKILSQKDGEVIFENVDGGSFWLDIQETGKNGNHIRDITIVREDRVALYEAGATFNPDWLKIVSDANQLRYLNWMRANNATIESWDDRSTPDDVSWASGKGVPVEIMVKLANETGTDPWFTIPHTADDNYIRQFATYVRDHLDPNLKAHVEYSNEVWNWSFQQAHWMDEQARTAWGEENAWVDYYAKRATETALIWNDVFGNESDARLSHVLGAQSGNTWIAERAMGAPIWKLHEPDAYVRPASVFDNIAITSYFGDSEMRSATFRAELLAAIADPSVDAMAFLTARLRDPDHPFSIPHVIEFLKSHKALATENGLGLVLYEGGQHVHQKFGVSGMTQEESAKLSKFMIDYIRSDHMAELYNELWQAWREIGDGPFNQYGDVGVPSEWGSWALLSHLGDTTPRYELLKALNESVAAWWEKLPGEVRQDGVTLYAEAGGSTLVGTVKTDYLIGGDGDDILIGHGGNDGINGGGGNDVAVMPGAQGDYEVTVEGIGYRIVGPSGSAFVVDVETLLFEDGTRLTLPSLRTGSDPDPNPPTDPVSSPSKGKLVDGQGTAAIALEGSADLIVAAINGWSALGRELRAEHGAQGPMYVAYQDSATSVIDGRKIGANYWTIEENTTGFGGSPISDSALKTALSLAGVYINVGAISGGAGNDRLMGRGSADYLIGGDGNDVLIGAAGDDTLSGGGGSNRLDGGDGIDLAQFLGSASEHTLSVTGTGVSVSRANGVDQLDGIERIAFGSGPARELSTWLEAMADSGAAKARLSERGALTDADGEAVIVVEEQGVVVDAVNRWSGLGRELGQISSSAPDYVVTGRSGISAVFDGTTMGANYWTLQENHSAMGGVKLDVSASAAALKLGALILDAGVVIGTSFNDIFNGSERADSFNGGAGDDILSGQGGADVLIGGRGNDLISGGTGADRFVFTPGDGSDRITDFSSQDILDLRGLGLASTASLTGMASTDEAGRLMISYEGGSVTFDGLTFHDLQWMHVLL